MAITTESAARNPFPAKEAIDPLYARANRAYGEQDDYFDHPNTIGWVRRGIPEIEFSGRAVVIANGEAGDKRMFVGKHRAGRYG